MVYIYLLECQNGKYYVGKTNKPDIRIEQHFTSGGSAWTKRYPPIKVLEFICDCDDYDEDKYTRIYMDKYGIDNVRGGSFCEEILDETTRKMLEKMSNSAKNKCFTCGLVGHFAKECGKCEKLESIDKCLTAMETFIEEKKKLELVDVPFEIPPPGRLCNSSKDCELLVIERKRAKAQKEKNDEYLPMFSVILTAIQLLNDKTTIQKPNKETPYTKTVPTSEEACGTKSIKNHVKIGDVIAQVCNQNGLNIHEDTANLIAGMFV